MPEQIDNPLYYLENFRAVLNGVVDRYGDVLTTLEQRFIAGFTDLSRESQALLVRMVMRKGSLFRASKLRYDEVGPIAVAAAELCAKGWLTEDPPLPLLSLAQLVTRAECQAMFAGQLSRHNLTKGQLVSELCERHGDRKARAREWCPEFTDPIYELQVQEICDTLRLLYFGNLNQDWSEFVLRDLGMLRFEEVPLMTGERAFRDREDIALYQTLFHCREELEQGDSPLEELIERVERLETDSAWLAQRLAKVRFLLGRECERRGAFAEAGRLYGASAWPDARVRHARVLELQGQYADAWGILQAVLGEPRNGAELQRAKRSAPRIARQLGLRVDRVRAVAHEQIELTLPSCDEYRVETAVALHFAHEGAPVFFVENTLIPALFGLLCWDAIFAPVPCAFFNPFQAGPADLSQPDFVARRHAQFRACVAAVDDGTYRDTILNRFTQKLGIQNPFVRWGAIDKALLELAVRCIPGGHLKVWVEHLLADIVGNRCGLPDLIQFSVEECAYQLIEVKGPGDRLEDNQKQWLEVFAQYGHPVVVCHVRWEL